MKKVKAMPEKEICMKEGQVKQLLDSARGVNLDCDAADEYIEKLDERYDSDDIEIEKPSKKEVSLLERIIKEWL